MGDIEDEIGAVGGTEEGHGGRPNLRNEELEVKDIDDTGAEKDIEGSGEAEEARGENEIGKLKAENDELVAALKRLQAEFENYQKRADRERASSGERGKQEVLGKLIVLADEFEAAVQHMHRSSESELRNGIRLLQKKLASILEGEGVTGIECLGKKFDPDICDAVEVVEDDGPEGVVVKEMRKGYLRNGQVLRHAMVGVTKKTRNNDGIDKR